MGIDNEQFREFLEGLEIEYKKIDEILFAMDNFLNIPDNLNQEQTNKIVEQQIEKIKNLLAEEKDWKEKAKLSAELIKLKLST